jgi:hypothetical protein
MVALAVYKCQVASIVGRKRIDYMMTLRRQPVLLQARKPVYDDTIQLSSEQSRA